MGSVLYNEFGVSKGYFKGGNEVRDEGLRFKVLLWGWK